MRTFTRFLSILTLAACLNPNVEAGLITSLYGTGVDDQGVVLADGAVDPHYTADVGAGPFKISNGTAVGMGWEGNTATSAWISTSPGAFGMADTNFTTTFDLTGFAPGTAFISGMITADNGVTVYLNGVRKFEYLNTGFIAPWASFVPFAIQSGFIEGINTLRFFVANNGGLDGLGGLQVQMSGRVVPVSEPSTLASAGLGGLLVLGLRRKRAAGANL